MPRHIFYRARLGLTVGLLVMSFGGEASAQSAANVAEDFLSKVENGNTGGAFNMLSDGARHGHSPADLKAPPRDPASTRRVAFQGPIDPSEIGQHAPGNYFVVCIIDVPKGSGAVTDIAVTLVAEPQSSQLRIADYRYDSHPAPACASRI